MTSAGTFIFSMYDFCCSAIVLRSLSTNDDNFSVGPSQSWFPSNGPKQLNENYTNQQKDYQIIGYLDQIQQRKLKIPESFLVKFNLSDMVEFSQFDRVCHPRLPLSLQNSL